MSERPISFSPQMVRAILDGHKTETRRVLTHAWDGHQWAWGVYPAKTGWVAHFGMRIENAEQFTQRNIERGFACRYGSAGDRLWVREPWTRDEAGAILYRADADLPNCRWLPGFLLPRSASRIALEIKSVRAERLQDISAESSIAEGMHTNLREHEAVCELRDRYHALWDWLNAKRGYPWDTNPWVWAIAFRRLKHAETPTGGETECRISG